MVFELQLTEHIYYSSASSLTQDTIRMAEEQKITAVTEATNPNAAAEQDVKDVLAELKPDEASKPDSADAEKAEEDKIVEAAKLLGEEALSSEKAKEASGTQKGRGSGRGRGRGGVRINYRDNIKSDAASLEETDDPVEIRKQVCSPVPCCI